ncbi:MAG TPA: DUF502 domain-containing protein [Acetobacteraceae bacterium]|nr:DUF502 domain-containing protein [Acetobacteraceae bacterium]
MVTKSLEAIRTTIVGGILFLIPIFIIVWILVKIFDTASSIALPVSRWSGVHSVAGVGAVTVFAIVLMILAAFLAGLFARISFGQSVLRWLEGGFLATMPQFSFLEGVVKSFDTSANQVPIVLVPTDAGWTLGMMLETQVGDWNAVFLPSSPQWTSGSISYAHSDNIIPVDLTLADLMMLMRKRGVGSASVFQALRSSDRIRESSPAG